MIKTALVLVLFLLLITNVNAACRNTFSPPYFECDTNKEAQSIMRKKVYSFSFWDEEDEEADNGGSKVIVIKELYNEHKIEVITNPYQGVDYDNFSVHYINMKKLKNLKINNDKR